MNIVVFASGEGSNFLTLVNAFNQPDSAINIVALFSDRKKSGAVDKAQNLNIKCEIHSLKNFTSQAVWEQTLLDDLQKYQPDLIVLAGYLKKIPASVVEAYPQKIINTHPSLLPKFGGAGMFGRKVHQAVLAANELTTGVTVHYVTEKFDEGPIVDQKFISIDSNETIESLEEKVKKVENQFLVEVIKKISNS